MLRKRRRPGKDPPHAPPGVGIIDRSPKLSAADGLNTSLRALKESPDAFPPLKSVVGGALAIYDIAQRVSRSKRTAKDLADRTIQTLYILAENVPDATAISPDMLNNISRFEVVLNDLHAALERLALQGRWKRLFHLNSNEGELDVFKQRLEVACQAFTIGSTMRIERTVAVVQSEVMTSRTATLVQIETSSRIFLKAHDDLRRTVLRTVVLFD